MYECIGHLPCVVFDDQTWSDNFDQRFITRTSKKDAVEILQTLYECVNLNQCDLPSQLRYVLDLDNSADREWSKLLS